MECHTGTCVSFFYIENVHFKLYIKILSASLVRYDKAPRLLFLEINQLSNLVTRLSQLHKYGRVTENSSSLLVLMPMCFPEFYDRPEVSSELISQCSLHVLSERIF